MFLTVKKNSFSQMLFAILVVLSLALVGVANERKKFVPPGMHEDMFPEAVFDQSSPYCTALRDPCGFYSFSLGASQPMKWVKSWCRCDSRHECVYDKTDLKMRVYRQICVSKTDVRRSEDLFN